MKLNYIFFLILIFLLKNGFTQDWKHKIDPLLSSIYHQRFDRSLLSKSNVNDQYKIAFIPSMPNLVDETKADPEVRVFMLATNSIDELESHGVKVQSKIGNTMTAHIPLSLLPEIAQLQGIQAIQTGMPVFLELDVNSDKIKKHKNSS